MKAKKTYNTGDARITKIRLMYEVNNDKCHNFYFEVRFRIYTNATHFYRGNFVVWFDVFDLAEEYPDKERYSKADIRNYAETLAWSFLDGYAPKKEINGDTMRPFYNECRESIMHYNRIAA